MIRRLFAFLALLALANTAVAQQLPLVNMDGQTRQLPAGATLTVQPSTTGSASLKIPHGIAPSSPVDGDCWTTTGGLFCRINGTTVGPYNTGVGSVTSVGISPPAIFTGGAPVTSSGNLSFSLNSQSANSVLAAPDGTPGVPTFRGLAIGDMPSDMSAINVTALTQTKTASQWVSYLGGVGVLPGCVGDGVADDTACLQAAVDAHQNGTLYLGSGLYKVSSGITSAGQITIVGSGGGQGEYNRTCLRGIRSASATINVLTLQAAGSKVYNICIDTSVTPSAGAYIYAVGAVNSVIISDSQFNDPFQGIYLTGSGATQNVNGHIARNVILPVNNVAASAIHLGALSTGGNTVDTYVSENTIYCNNSARGMILNDVGGTLVHANAIYGCSIGTLINPFANQQAIWLYFTGTVVGDTSSENDLVIDTGAASAVITGLQFTGSWTSSSTGGPSVKIRDTGASASVLGIHFVGHRTYMGSNQNGFDIGAGQKITIDASTICSTGTSSGIGILLSGGVAGSAIRNNSIGACDHPVAGSLATGVSITQTGGFVGIVRGNDFANTTTPINFAPSTGAATTAIIGDNIGVDNLVSSIASSATIALTPVPRYLISGTTTVTTINGGWGNRQVTWVPTNAAGLTFNTGGNICNSVVATQNQPVTGFYDAGSSCWRIR